MALKEVDLPVDDLLVLAKEGHLWWEYGALCPVLVTRASMPHVVVMRGCRNWRFYIDVEE